MTDALLAFANDIQAAWNHDKVMSALIFNIKGYFDFVNHDRLLCVLWQKHIPLPYIRWVKSFLSDRQAAVCLDGMCSTMKAVINGIPQGLPVSPILAGLYTDELVEIFKPNSSSVNNPLSLPDHPTDTTLFMYIDNGLLFVSSDSLDTNICLLKTAYQKAATWLRKVGLALDLVKRELMHYTQKKRDGSPAIQIMDDDNIICTITVSSSVKWLGVHFDCKLLFNQNVKQMAARTEGVVGKLTMLANTVKGLSQVHLRHL